MPAFLRASVLRFLFKTEYEQPAEFVIKKAETADELKQALILTQNLRENKSRLHFSKYMALPTTTILVAKWKEEVVGAVTIVPDGSCGLPSDPVWNENNLRKDGNLLVEISSFFVKKEFHFRQSDILMGLCKGVYLFSTQILKASTVVTILTRESEFFYTDILLFESIRPQKNKSWTLSNNPTALWGHLCLEKFQERCKKTYQGKRKSKNLHHYFVEASSPWIQVADKNIGKNVTLLQKNQLLRRSRPRFEIATPAMAFVNGSTVPESCKVINISESGLQIKLDQPHHQDLLGKPILIVFEHEKEWITCPAVIKWLESQKRLGCMVYEKSYSWKKFLDVAVNDADYELYKVA